MGNDLNKDRGNVSQTPGQQMHATFTGDIKSFK